MAAPARNQDQNNEPAKPAESKAVAPAAPNRQMAAAGKVTSPMNEAANMVRRYATGLINDKRAQQFAFQMSIMTKDPKNGAKLLACSSESIISAMMACVHYDLMPNTPDQYAYIIPYGSTAQFQLGYKGLVELAYRSSVIKTINAELVFPEDTFDIDLGMDRHLTHKPSMLVADRTDYSKAIACYATAKLDSGEFVFEVLTKPDLEKVRKSSQAGSNGPWKDWPEAMAKKTAVKRLLKLLPGSAKDNRFKEAAQLDSAIEGGGKLNVSDDGKVSVIEGETVEEVSEDTKVRIADAQTREDLVALMGSLSVAERKAATGLVNDRVAELAAAKKQAA